ncbi:MAG: DUF5674 family protein [Candidatus Moranbacteria bacterium]|nr:DUF5674 family protein [Candidatus Moranbacteria bacterium]
MQLVTQEKKISRETLQIFSEKMFGGLVKAVVDINQAIMLVDAEMHADEETVLLEQGSQQAALWGINLYPAEEGGSFLEFDSMINIRPGQGNRSRGVEDVETQEKIRKIVENLVEL